MMRHVLKPAYWIWNRRFQAMNKYVIALMLAGLFIIAEIGYNRFLRGNLSALAADDVVAIMLISGLLVTAFVALLDLKNILYQLFQSPDLALLMVNPVPLRVIYGLKLSQCGWSTFISAGFLAGSLFLVGIERDAPFYFYPLMVVAAVGWALMIVAATVTLVLAISRLISPRRLENWGFVSLVLLPLAIIIAQEPLVNWFATQTELQTALIDWLMNGFAIAAIMVTGALIVNLAAFRVFVAVFYTGMSDYQTVTSPTTRRRTPSNRWIVKEWLTIRRDPRLMMGFAQPLLYFGLLLIPIMGGRAIPAELTALSFWLILILAGMSGILSINTPVQIMLNDGQNIGLIRAQPVSAGQMLRVKLAVAVLPQIITWSAGTLLTGMIYGLPPPQIIDLCLIVSVVIGGSAVMGVTVGGWLGDFRQRELSLIPNIGLFLLNGLWSGGVVVTVIAVIQRWMPDSDLNQILTQLNIQFGAWVLPSAFGVVMALAVVVVWLWRRACARLESYETA